MWGAWREVGKSRAISSHHWLQPLQAGCFSLCHCHLSRAPRKEHPSVSPEHPSAGHEPGFACHKAIHRKLPPGKPAGPGPNSDCLSTEPCSSGKVGSLVGMGRTQLGVLRLAPANTFRKYGFLVNRVEKENFLTDLPRAKLSPGECAPHCQDWLCQRVQRVHLPPSTAHLTPAARCI